MRASVLDSCASQKPQPTGLACESGYAARSMKLPSILIGAVALSLGADKPVFSWRFSGEHLEDAKLLQSEGKSATKSISLSARGELRFVGGREQAALVRHADDAVLVSEAPIPSRLLPRKALTLEAWVALDMSHPDGALLSTFAREERDNRGWLLGYRHNEFRFGISTESPSQPSRQPGANDAPDSLQFVLAPPAFSPGKWYHVAGTYDGEVQRLYVNAMLVDERPLTGSILYFDQHRLSVGAKTPKHQGQSMVGALYEVRVFDKALSAKTLRARYEKLHGQMPTPQGRSFTGIERAVAPAVLSFQPSIEDAIDGGVRWLQERQNRDGSWSFMIDSHRNGGTALALYTLIKSGVSPDDPCSVAALEFLASGDPTRTYSVGCQLMALAAIGDMQHKEWVERLVQILLEYETANHRGIWGYPGGGDLSVTQYAALGLFAASKFGVQAPVETWQDLVSAAIDDFQLPSREVPWSGANPSKTGSNRIAGFSYRPNSGPGTATGSMTTAGLCVLGFANLSVGRRLGRRHLRMIERAKGPALAWLEHHYTVARNPAAERAGSGGGRTHYYLYGLERVAALYRLEKVGQFDWYRDGALWLLGNQNDDGSWSSHEKTCFAILFLTRATDSRRVATGREADRGTVKTAWLNDEGDVHLRITGDSELTMWVHGFSEGALRDFAASDAVLKRPAGLRIQRVQYLAEGVVFATLDGENGGWDGQRYAIQHTFAHPGARSIEVRVDLHDGTVLRSQPVSLTTRIDPTQWMQENLQSGLDNLLLKHLADVQVSASSVQNDNNRRADRALDGLDGTAWLSAPDDPEPWLSFDLRSPIEATGVVLTPVASNLTNRDALDRVVRIELEINGGKSSIDVGPDPLERIVIPFELPKKVRSLGVKIISRTPVGESLGSAGFAEVALVHED